MIETVENLIWQQDTRKSKLEKSSSEGEKDSTAFFLPLASLAWLHCVLTQIRSTEGGKEPSNFLPDRKIDIKILALLPEF